MKLYSINKAIYKSLDTDIISKYILKAVNPDIITIKNKQNSIANYKTMLNGYNYFIIQLGGLGDRVNINLNKDSLSVILDTILTGQEDTKSAILNELHEKGDFKFLNDLYIESSSFSSNKRINNNENYYKLYMFLKDMGKANVNFVYSSSESYLLDFDRDFKIDYNKILINDVSAVESPMLTQVIRNLIIKDRFSNQEIEVWEFYDKVTKIYNYSEKVNLKIFTFNNYITNVKSNSIYMIRV